MAGMSTASHSRPTARCWPPGASTGRGGSGPRPRPRAGWPSLDGLPDGDAATLRWQGGRTVIDIDERHPDLECEVCGDNDPCLPRWEDDGGEIDRPPSLARALEFEEDSERDHGND